MSSLNAEHLGYLQTIELLLPPGTAFHWTDDGWSNVLMIPLALHYCSLQRRWADEFSVEVRLTLRGEVSSSVETEQHIAMLILRQIIDPATFDFALNDADVDEVGNIRW